MKTLKDYARDHGIKYRAAWNRFKAGKIPSAFKDDFGKILIKEDKPNRPLKVFCYARISSSQLQSLLKSGLLEPGMCGLAIALGMDVAIPSEVRSFGTNKGKSNETKDPCVAIPSEVRSFGTYTGLKDRDISPTKSPARKGH